MNISNTFRAVSVAGAFCGLLLAPTVVSAIPINGSISFNGNLTAYQMANGTGAIAADYTTAHSIVFGPTVVSANASGSFSGIAQNTPVTSVYSPLQINGPVLPPPGNALWVVGGFTFTLSTLMEPFVAPNVLILQGTGVLAGPGYDNNTGTWIATFTSGTTTFSWNSSTASTTPDAGSSVMLLGLGLVSMCGVAAFRRQTAS